MNVTQKLLSIDRNARAIIEQFDSMQHSAQHSAHYSMKMLFDFFIYLYLAKPDIDVVLSKSFSMPLFDKIDILNSYKVFQRQAFHEFAILPSKTAGQIDYSPCSCGISYRQWKENLAQNVTVSHTSTPPDAPPVLCTLRDNVDKYMRMYGKRQQFLNFTEQWRG